MTVNASIQARNGLIEARGVVKSFGQTPALRGADVRVAAGEILAVTAGRRQAGRRIM